jgi:malonate transporter
MLVAFESLLPVLLVIALGVGLRAANLLDAHQWTGFEKLAYHVFFPAIVIHTLASSDLANVPFGRLGATLLCAVLSMAAIALTLRPLLVRRLHIDGPAFTSLFQGATRWNTFVAIAVAAQLFGREGLALMAVAIAAMVPVLNLLCVGVLMRYASPGGVSPRRFVVELTTNPFIWSSLLGIVINLSGVRLPDVLLTALDITGRGALVAGILALGAGLNIAVLHRPSRAALVSAGLRLLVMPSLAALYAALFGLTGVALGAALVATAVPSATGAYVLARRMGGDAPLMAEILTFQTVAAMLTLPLMFGLYL